MLETESACRRNSEAPCAFLNPTNYLEEANEKMNPVYDFETQVALVTGTGLATARAFAEAGADSVHRFHRFTQRGQAATKGDFS